MRILKIAALAAVLLSATSANAYYFQTSGVKGPPDSFGLPTGFDQGTTYYFQLESAGLSGISFEEHFQQTVYHVGGAFDGQIAFKGFQTVVVPYQTTAFGAVGTFMFPEDGPAVPPLQSRYDLFGFVFYPPYGNTVTEPNGTPWTLTVSDAPITAPGSVPEPATWAMMIAGFGFVGATLRRRRRALA